MQHARGCSRMGFICGPSTCKGMPSLAIIAVGIVAMTVSSCSQEASITREHYTIGPDVHVARFRVSAADYPVALEWVRRNETTEVVALVKPHETLCVDAVFVAGINGRAYMWLLGRDVSRRVAIDVPEGTSGKAQTRVVEVSESGPVPAGGESVAIMSARWIRGADATREDMIIDEISVKVASE